jgi:type I restriction enzyme S subunit
MNALGEIFKISKGKKAIESSFETTLRYIQIGDLRNDDVMKYTTQSSTNVLCTKDDILIAWDGANAGTVGYNLEGVVGSTLAKLSPKKEGVHINYVGRFLQSKFEYLRENCTGATIPHLSRPVLENLQIPLPPLEQQKKIAAILDAADAYRQKTKTLIAKYDELTQSLFLDMFGDPVKNEKGWDMKIMANVCEKISVGFVGVCEPYYTEKQEGIPMLRTGNLGEGFLRYDKMKFVTKEFHKKQKKSQIFKDDILIARHGDNGKAVLYNGEFEEANCLNIIILRPSKGLLNGTYNVNMLNNESTRNRILGKTGGATQKVVNTKEIQKLIVPIPPINIQTQFAERVAIIEQQKVIAQASLEKAEELFNSLLQKAFKGELM